MATFIASYDNLLVSSVMTVYRKLCLAFLTHIARLAVLRRPPQTILRFYQKTFCQMQLLNLMFQDLPRVKLEADLLEVSGFTK